MDTQNYKVIDSFLHPFTHSTADGQMAATKQLLDPDRSLLPVAAQGWDDWRATEAERGSGWSPSQSRPLPWGAAPQDRLLLLGTTCLHALGLFLWVLLLCMYLLFSLSLPVFRSLLFPTCLSLWGPSFTLAGKMHPLGVCVYAHKPLLGVPCNLSGLHTQSSRLSIPPISVTHSVAHRLKSPTQGCSLPCWATG